MPLGTLNPQASAAVVQTKGLWVEGRNKTCINISYLRTIQDDHQGWSDLSLYIRNLLKNGTFWKITKKTSNFGENIFKSARCSQGKWKKQFTKAWDLNFTKQTKTKCICIAICRTLLCKVRRCAAKAGPWLIHPGLCWHCLQVEGSPEDIQPPGGHL